MKTSNQKTQKMKYIAPEITPFQDPENVYIGIGTSSEGGDQDWETSFDDE